MANQTLTLTYSTTTRKVTKSGLDGPMHASIARFLTRNGIDFSGDSGEGRILDPDAFTAERRAAIVTAFDAAFDQDPNPAHATDNFTLAFTAA